MPTNLAPWSFLFSCLLSVTLLADTGSVEMGFHYPFDRRSDNFVMTTAAQADGKVLTIGLTEAKGFKQYAMGFGFLGVMDGTETRFNDSDAAHVTVAWKNDAGEVLGRVTNATPQKPRRGPKHPAAEWKALDATPAKLVWEVEIPAKAVQMEIVAVYTDTLTNTPSHAAKDRHRSNTSGDMPLIFASYSGKLAEGQWSFTARPEDVEETRQFSLGSFPTVAQIEATVTAVKKRLRDRTGYRIVARPPRLDGISAPIGIGYRDLIKKIDDATSAGDINGRLDTGFDVIPEPTAREF